jgi:hypothetical protein
MSRIRKYISDNAQNWDNNWQKYSSNKIVDCFQSQ